MVDEAKVSAWLEDIDCGNQEFGYRYVYAAYLAASGYTVPVDKGEISMVRDPDGGYLLQAPSPPSQLRLDNDADREAFVRYLVRRYCGARYPSMDEWEAAQHADYLEDARFWYGGQ